MSQVTIDADSFRAFEAAGWEEKADPYHRFFGPITSLIIEPLLDAAEIGAGTSALDVATGPGYVAAGAAERGASVVGTDIATAMVALARELNPGIEFRQADAENLPFADGAFDSVTGNFVLPHLGRPERAVAECARVLAPGWRIVLSMWDAPDQNRLFGVLTEAVSTAGAPPANDVPSGPPFFRFSSDEALSALLAAAGFEQVEVRGLSFTHRLSRADELWSGLAGGTVRMAALVSGQGEEMRRRIHAAFDRIVSEYMVAGILNIPVSVKVASGRKPEGVSM